MLEFLTFAFSWANALFSMLVVVMLLYWAMVVFGVFGHDLFDIDLDVDVDVEGEVDAAEVHSIGGPFEALLTFFYVGKVPVMILASTLIFSMWIAAMLGNYWMNPEGGLLLGLPVAGAAVLAGIICVKIIGWPLGKLFGALNDEHGARNLKLTGRICSVLTTTNDQRMGQAEIRAGGAPIVISILAEKNNEFNRGDEALIFEHDKNRNVYLIAPVDLER